ncbi:hypothetical protein ACQQ2N_03080 [Dokdonella sp. MW10]|uniref:hypothetical protein n=1 Tax=Dokdonella sp. MW10 TaxID=2992926 RepID=UPI003F7E8E85
MTPRAAMSTDLLRWQRLVMRKRLAIAVCVMAAVACMAPPTCLALGVEDTAFVGLRDDGGLVRLAYKDDAPAGSPGGAVYGATSPASLAFCRATKVDEVAVRLSCASAPDRDPAIVYDALPIPAQGMHPPQGAPYADEYRELARAAKLGSGTQRGDALVQAIYVCSRGCTPEVPARLYQVGFHD